MSLLQFSLYQMVDVQCMPDDDVWVPGMIEVIMHDGEKIDALGVVLFGGNRITVKPEQCRKIEHHAAIERAADEMANAVREFLETFPKDQFDHGLALTLACYHATKREPKLVNRDERFSKEIERLRNKVDGPIVDPAAWDGLMDFLHVATCDHEFEHKTTPDSPDGPAEHFAVCKHCGFEK